MFNKKITYIVNASLALLGLLLYLSYKTLLAFVGFYTFMAMPIILGILQVIGAVFSIIFIKKPNKIGTIIIFVWNIIFLTLCIVLLVFFKGSIKDILMQGWHIALIMLSIAVVVFVIFYLPKWEHKHKKIISIVLCVVICAGIVVGFTDLKNLRINYIKQGAVVYAVGEDYQIVWTTEVKGSGYVEIGGLTFYDTIAGSSTTEQKVHKVIVPQAVLNEAKAYTVKTRKMVAEQGFYATQGGIVSRSYTFRPVDESDGLQFITLTDTHDFNNIAAKTAAAMGAKTDFVIMAGDIVSFLENDTDLNRIVNLAYQLTKGKIPVIFARGNHELKSEKAEQLHRYVGAKGSDYYYTFRLGSVWGVVLDMGEDHDDDWYEFFGTAQFAKYRKDQIAFLDEILDSKEYQGADITLRLGICHIPTAFTGIKRDYMYDDLVSINMRLNQLDLRCMISGHLHEIFITDKHYAAGTPLSYDSNYRTDVKEPKYIATGASYYNIIASKSCRTQKGKAKLGREFTAANFDFSDNILTLKFVNDKLQTVPTVSAFEDKVYGKEIII